MRESNEQMAEKLETWVVFADRKRSTGAVEPTVNKVVDSMERACIAGAAALRLVDALGGENARLRESVTDWQPIETAIAAYSLGVLRPCQVILTKHQDDLYPVCAYWLPPNGTEAGLWMRSVEGPEDICIEGANIPLYRPPTHWQPVPGSNPALTNTPATAEWLQTHDAQVRRQLLEDLANESTYILDANQQQWLREKAAQPAKENDHAV